MDTPTTGSHETSSGGEEHTSYHGVQGTQCCKEELTRRIVLEEKNSQQAECALVHTEGTVRYYDVRTADKQGRQHSG